MFGTRYVKVFKKKKSEITTLKKDNIFNRQVLFRT